MIDNRLAPAKVGCAGTERLLIMILASMMQANTPPDWNYVSFAISLRLELRDHIVAKTLHLD